MIGEVNTKLGGRVRVFPWALLASADDSRVESDDLMVVLDVPGEELARQAQIILSDSDRLELIRALGGTA